MARPVHDPSPLAAFLALPALPSLIFPVSAACLAGGAWAVLGPAMADADRLAERLAAAGMVAAYAGALALAARLLVRWQAGNPDAVGVVLLLAMVLGGGGMALDTIAYTSPAAATLLGAVHALLGATCAWILHRRILPGGPAWAPVALAVYAAWHGLAPAWAGTFAAAAEPLGDPADPFMPGWLLQISLAWAVAWLPLGGRADAPFLHRPMAWRAVLLAAVAAGGLHTGAQGWMLMLQPDWAEHLAWVAPALLAAWRDLPWQGAAGTGLRVLTTLIPFAVLLGGAVCRHPLALHAGEDGLAGWGLAVGGWVSLPVVTGALVALWAAAQAVRRRDAAAAGLAVAALAAAVAVIPWRGGLFLHGIPALAVLVGGLVAWAAMRRRWELIVAIAAATGLAAWLWWCLQTPARQRPDAAWGVAAAAALPLLAGMVHPSLWPAPLRRVTAAVLGVLGGIWAAHLQAAAAVAVVVPVAAALRARDWRTAVGGLLPAAPAAWAWPGWAAIAGAFVLVGAGLAASWRRISAPPPVPAAQAEAAGAEAQRATA
ncbi:MAG: hypothetical protein RLZZ127_1805 [Planctomycetota bacterium]|jgi:hypothetical protein